MQTQRIRLTNLVLKIAGINAIIDSATLEEKIPSGLIGAIYKDKETGKMHVIGLAEAAEFEPNENHICLLSAPRIKGKDGQQLRAFVVTKSVGYELTGQDRADFLQYAESVSGPYTGKHHDVNDADYDTGGWISGGVNMDNYSGTFIDATTMKDNAGQPLMLLLSDGANEPLIRILTVEGVELGVKLVGKAEQISKLTPWSVSREFGDGKGNKYIAINMLDDAMALLEVQYADGDQVKFVVTSVVNVEGEITVKDADGDDFSVGALIGPGKNGKYGVFTPNGIPTVLTEAQTSELMEKLELATSAQQSAA